MALLSPPVTIERPNAGHGGGVHPPAFGGGDDNGPGDSFPDYGRRLYRARLGLILGIVSISVLFITVTAVFVLLRHSALSFGGRRSYLSEWVEVALPIRLLLVNTVVLLLSSLTIEKARRSVTREMALAPVRGIPGIALDSERGMPWLAITITLGLLFLGGQWMAWQSLLARGFSVHSSTSSSFVYVLTATHAVHLGGGILVLLYAGIISLLHRAVESRLIVLEIAGWYWHFMAILWIYIFALLQFGR